MLTIADKKLEEICPQIRTIKKKKKKNIYIYIYVRSQIVAQTQIEAGDGPNKPSTINL